MARINLEVKTELYQRFRDNCSLDGLSVSEVIRGLMVEYNRRRTIDQYMARTTPAAGSGDDVVSRELRREVNLEKSDD